MLVQDIFSRVESKHDRLCALKYKLRSLLHGPTDYFIATMLAVYDDGKNCFQKSDLSILWRTLFFAPKFQFYDYSVDLILIASFSVGQQVELI